MKIEVGQSLGSYLKAADDTAHALLTEGGPLIDLLQSSYDYFADVLWTEVDDMDAWAAMLAMNAFMLYLAGVRIALAGHFVAIFPIMRTALESACYSYLIADKPELAKIWRNRHDDEPSRKASRRVFGPAVAKVSSAIEAQGPGMGTWILDAYDHAIDFGGHPNVKAVLENARLTEDQAAVTFSLTALHGPHDWQTQRGIVACGDFAVAIAAVLTHALGEASEAHQSALQSLNDRKNDVAEALQNGDLVSPG